MNDRKPTVISAFLVTLGACVVLWVSGCSFTTTNSEKQSSTVSATADPALTGAIRQALDAMKALTSVHLVIRTSGKVDSMAGITSADVDARVNPLVAKGVCTYQGQSDVPFRVKDGNIAVKLFDDWSNLGSVSDLAAPRIVDATDGVAQIVSGITDLQSQGSEVIDGIRATKISGTLPTETVKMFDPGARKSMPATVWIAQDGSGHLVRANMNLGSGSVQVDLSQWNEPVSVD